MTIEFQCSECGRAMRAPDTAAGKHGKCPQCGTVMEIPAPEPEVPAATRTADGKIEFPCPSCGEAVRTPAAAAGKRGKCPHCGDIMQIPNLDDAVDESEPEAAPSPPPAPVSPKPRPAASVPAPQPRAADGGGEMVEFPCTNCQHKMRAPAAMAGKNGKCPRCQTVVRIPAGGSAAPARTPAPGLTPLGPSGPKKPAAARPAANAGRGGLTPLPSSGGLTPLPDAGGLTPLPDAGGLTPLTPLSAPAGLTPLGAPAGLTPLSPPAGLTPLSAPGGLMPLDPLGGAGPMASGSNPFDGFGAPAAGGFGSAAPNPFAGVGGATNAYAGVGGAVNPYAAPSASPFGGAAMGSGGSRRGTVQFGEAIGSAWNTFSPNFGQAILLGLSPVLLMIFFVVGAAVVQLVTRQIGILELSVVIFGLTMLVALGILVYVLTGFQYACLRWARTGTLNNGDFFSAGRFTLSVLAIQFLIGLMTGGITLVSYLPGLVLYVGGMEGLGALVNLVCSLLGGLVAAFVGTKFGMAPFYLMDRGLGVIDALGASFRAMTIQNCFMAMVTMFVASMVGGFLVGVTCYLGALVVYPFLMLLFAKMYMQVAD